MQYSQPGAYDMKTGHTLTRRWGSGRTLVEALVSYPLAVLVFESEPRLLVVLVVDLLAGPLTRFLTGFQARLIMEVLFQLLSAVLAVIVSVR